MKKILFTLMAIVLLAGTCLTGCGTEEENDVINMNLCTWDTGRFQCWVAKMIVEEGYDYPVEFVSATPIIIFESLCSGEVDVMMEGWYPNQQDVVDPALEEGSIEWIATTNDETWESLFVVPTYVIEGDPERGIEPMAPDLKSVYDLFDPQYVELFQDPEDPSKGSIVACASGGPSELICVAKIKTYGLDDYYNLLFPGSYDAIHASLAAAYLKGEPWIGYEWGPTYASGKYDLTLLEEPPYDEDLWSEEAGYGCSWVSNQMYIAARKDFSSDYPDLAEMFSKWRMDTQLLSEALAYIQDNEVEPEAAAVWFLKTREDVWTEYVPSDVAQKIKDAVAVIE